MEELKEDELAKFHIRKRRKKRIILTSICVVFILIAVIFLTRYWILNKKISIKYKESSNIDYGVNLLPNEFYKTERLGENVDVISSLIKDIEVEFKYNMNLEKEIPYTYDYKILAIIELKEKSKTNLIYSDEQIAIQHQPTESNSKRLEITEKMTLSYNDYNNQINKLIEQFRLDNTVSELSLLMQLNVINQDTKERINKETNVMKITIPLDTKTVEISVNENIKDYNGEIIIEENTNKDTQKYLYFGITMLLCGLIVLVLLVRYISKTRSAEKMYERELNKILFDYKSYVQKINTTIDYDAYKIIKVDTFIELLQMREELQAPILMYTEKSNLKTIFMMIKDDILFTYTISSKAIRNKLIEESKKRKSEKNEKNK